MTKVNSLESIQSRYGRSRCVFKLGDLVTLDGHFSYYYQNDVGIIVSKEKGAIWHIMFVSSGGSTYILRVHPDNIRHVDSETSPQT